MELRLSSCGMVLSTLALFSLLSFVSPESSGTFRSSPNISSLRRLLVRGEYAAAAMVAREATAATGKLVADLHPSDESDVALALWLASTHTSDDADEALRVFLKLGRNEDLPIQTRLAAMRNAEFIEKTRDGHKEGWKNFDRAYELERDVEELFRTELEACMIGDNDGDGGRNHSKRPIHVSSASEIPLTSYDLDLNARICTFPGLSPPRHFVCGDRTSLGSRYTKGGGAVEAAVARATDGQRIATANPKLYEDRQGKGHLWVDSSIGGAIGQLYLDMMRRSLVNYVYGNLEREMGSIIGEAMASTPQGPIQCGPDGDAQGTACAMPHSLTFRGFGLDNADLRRDSSQVEQKEHDALTRVAISSNDSNSKSWLAEQREQAHTTLSLATMTHLQLVVERVLQRGVQGDLIETGVFRGGATIFMRALLAAHDLTSNSNDGGGRIVYVADSFAGIPQSRRPISTGEDDSVMKEECDTWEERYAVSRGSVEANFRRYGLLDDRVAILQGFFNVSLPPIFGPFPLAHQPSAYVHPAANNRHLKNAAEGQNVGVSQQPPLQQHQQHQRHGLGDNALDDPEGYPLRNRLYHHKGTESRIERDKDLGGVPSLAVIRIDADAYDGVRDALESLYPRLSSGGTVIIDDWHLVGAAAAAHEYRRHHGITAPIFIAPSDFVHSCSVGGPRLGDMNHEDKEFFVGPLDVGDIAGPAEVRDCLHPRTSLFLHNNHLITRLPPHVAYWYKP